MIEEKHKDLSVRSQCQLLTVNRSTFYYRPSGCVHDRDLASEIQGLWMQMPFYGYRRLTAQLRRQGHVVNGKRTLRLMREMGLQALYPKPKTTVRFPKHKIFPYLLKGLEVTRPNHVWSTDITYIKMAQGFGYLVALIDVYSRKVLSWRLSNTMDVAFCLEMLEDALKKGRPEILNTDQGSQFTSEAWVKHVEEAGIQVSMDGKGRWVDNVFIERFWRTLKHEHVLLHSFENLHQARHSIGAFIKTYNQKRLHQSLGYHTPNEVYGGLRKVEILSNPQKSKPIDMWITLTSYPTRSTGPTTTQTVTTERENSHLF